MNKARDRLARLLRGMLKRDMIAREYYYAITSLINQAILEEKEKAIGETKQSLIHRGIH